MSEVPYSEMFRAFGRIGVLSFGGPAAQIGLMHRVLVDERRWLKDDEFLRALSFCMLLPGPEAMQLATYAGWKLRGVPGGLIAGLLFVLPGAVVMACLALIYVTIGTAPQMQAALTGIKAAVIVIVAQAVIRLSSKALDSRAAIILAVVAFVALFFFALPFPLVVLGAAVYGWISADSPDASGIPATGGTALPLHTVLIWTLLWLTPLPVLAAFGHSFLFEVGAFFATLAVVSFGGAYAVLAWMTQEAVTAQGWLSATEMVDALGLAETTPGPLILVTQFVGMLAGHGWHGIAGALVAGILTLWMTFVPCFLWIFAGAPYVETLLSRPRFAAALKAITAAVVGVIASLSLWFAMHVLFSRVRRVDTAIMAFDMPVFATISLVSVGLVVIAAVLLGPLRRGVPLTLAVLALAGWLAGQVGWLT